MKKAPLLILSGPSGSGKSTVIGRLLEDDAHRCRLSISATTRAPRPKEIEGVHYYFWSRAHFETALADGQFLEYAVVHGNYYGTLCSEIEPYRCANVGVILDIDVQGANQVRAKCSDHVSVFIRASSLDTYEARLRQRGTEDEATIRRRLDRARDEIALAGDYHYQVLNDDLDTAVAQLRAILHRHWEE